METLLSTPVHSIAQAIHSDPPCSFIFAAVSFGESSFDTFIACTLGTSFLAQSSLPWTRSVMISGSQPAAATHKSVTRPIGPAPQINVDIPRLNSARVAAARATLSGSSNAPSSKEMLSGRRCCWVSVRSSQRSCIRWSRIKFDIRTCIIPSCSTIKTLRFRARYAGLNSNSIASYQLNTQSFKTFFE